MEMLLVLSIVINLAVLAFLFVILRIINKNKMDNYSLQNTIKMFGDMISENVNEKQESFNKNIYFLFSCKMTYTNSYTTACPFLIMSNRIYSF